MYKWCLKSPKAIIFLLLFVVACAPVLQRGAIPLPRIEPVFCAQDVHTCPDGTPVARVPPHCAFAPCPLSSVPVPAQEPRLSLRVIPEPTSGVVPLDVKLTARITGTAPKNFKCSEARWDFGDGDTAKQAVECLFAPGALMTQSYSIAHMYFKPSNYTVTFTLNGYGASAVVAVFPPLGPPECSRDSDCVPAQCCHAADCVIKEKRPDCSKSFCTQECRPGTLDCGGSCACIQHRCTGQHFLPGVDTTEERPRPVLS
jgi:hypothetical protein